MKIERTLTLADFSTCMFCFHLTRKPSENGVDLDDFCGAHEKRIDELDSCSDHCLDPRISDLFRTGQHDRLKDVLVDAMTAYDGSE